MSMALRVVTGLVILQSRLAWYLGGGVLGVARYLQEPVIFQPENTCPRTDVRGLVSLTGVSCEELA